MTHCFLLHCIQTETVSFKAPGTLTNVVFPDFFFPLEGNLCVIYKIYKGWIYEVVYIQ